MFSISALLQDKLLFVKALRRLSAASASQQSQTLTLLQYDMQWHAVHSTTKDNFWCLSTHLTTGSSCLNSSFTRVKCSVSIYKAQSSQSRRGVTSPQNHYTLQPSFTATVVSLRLWQSCTVLAWLELNYRSWRCGRGTIGGEITCSSSGQCRHKRTAVRESEPLPKNRTHTGGATCMHTRTHPHTHTHTENDKGKVIQKYTGRETSLGTWYHDNSSHSSTGSTVYIPTSTSVTTACQ